MNRRTFIGSTIGGLTCSGLVGVSDAHTRAELLSGVKEKRPISYRFDLSPIQVNKISWLIPSQFPLKDKLIITYDLGKNFLRDETYIAWNWQLQGIQFDLGEFLKSELTNTNYRLYRNHKFYWIISSVYEYKELYP